MRETLISKLKIKIRIILIILRIGTLFLASFCLLWDSFFLLAAFFSRLLKKTQKFLNNLIILVKVQFLMK